MNLSELRNYVEEKKKEYSRMYDWAVKAQVMNDVLAHDLTTAMNLYTDILNKMNEQERETRLCATCKHRLCLLEFEPCQSCSDLNGRKNWEAA